MELNSQKLRGCTISRERVDVGCTCTRVKEGLGTKKGGFSTEFISDCGRITTAVIQSGLYIYQCNVGACGYMYVKNKRTCMYSHAKNNYFSLNRAKNRRM